MSDQQGLTVELIVILITVAVSNFVALCAALYFLVKLFVRRAWTDSRKLTWSVYFFSALAIVGDSGILVVQFRDPDYFVRVNNKNVFDSFPLSEKTYHFIFPFLEAW